MEPPQVRPGVVHEPTAGVQILAYFFNAAHGNSTIQLLTSMGVPNDRLGVTPPERIEGGQGMVLAIHCPDEALVPKVEAVCRSNGAQVHRRRS